MTAGDPFDVVGGTGHRQLSDAADQAWLQASLVKGCDWLRRIRGTRYVISGLARGFDMDWAEAALEAGLTLWAAIPFEGQEARWTKRDQARYAALRAAAARVRVTGHLSEDLPAKSRSAAVNTLLHKRNRVIVERSGALLTGWEPGRLDGGTAATLRIAATLGMPGIHVNPLACRVRHELPALADLEAFTLHHTVCGHVGHVGARAVIEARHADLRAAGHYSWRVRPARARETHGASCADCIGELADAAAAATRENVPV